MKKLAMAAVAVSLLGTAAQASSCASAFSGFYAGVQAGLNSVNGTLSGSNVAYNSVGTPGTNKISAGKNSFLGGLFAGYGMGVGSCAYVGGELYLNLGNSSITLQDDSSMPTLEGYWQTKYKSSYNLGAKLRLGYTVSQQAMIFVGLGLEYAKRTLTINNVLTGYSQSSVSAQTKKNKSSITFAPSVGMDILLNKNLFVRGEYTYVIGKTLTASPQYVSATYGKVTATFKAKLSQQRFVLGLGYKF